jgi:glycosyltransferase involved in cell wall biosynthesis
MCDNLLKKNLEEIMPYISVIIAVYDREKYIATAISSILSQTFSDLEIVIVDDGSTDGTVSIIKSFQSDRIRFFQNKHTGCWKTKNFAIREAKGEYLCFIDSDDFISPDFFERGIRIIRENANYEYYYPTSLDIVTTDAKPTGHIWRYIDYPGEQRQNLVRLFWERQIGGIPHAASLIHRDVFRRCGLYDDGFYNLADTEYIVRNATQINFFLATDLKTYSNRQHTQQTNANTNERMRTYSEILDTIISQYPTEYFLGVSMYKESPAFYQICVEKFMSLAENTEFPEWYQKKGEKYLRKSRQ